MCKIAVRCHSGTRLSPRAQRCAWRHQRGTLTEHSSRGILWTSFLQRNVLIDGTKNAVLCDFGIASIKDDVLSMSLNSRERSIAGTPNFMAPERLKGGPLRKPCDVYAFGMLIYEVCITHFRLL
jgi:hypothetical protein